jgi:hypothetical protein
MNSYYVQQMTLLIWRFTGLAAFIERVGSFYGLFPKRSARRNESFLPFSINPT